MPLDSVNPATVAAVAAVPPIEPNTREDAEGTFHDVVHQLEIDAIAELQGFADAATAIINDLDERVAELEEGGGTGGAGTVTSVNGVEPDESGNVTLDAAAVGAATAGALEDLEGRVEALEAGGGGGSVIVPISARHWRDHDMLQSSPLGFFAQNFGGGSSLVQSVGERYLRIRTNTSTANSGARLAQAPAGQLHQPGPWSSVRRLLWVVRDVTPAALSSFSIGAQPSSLGTEPTTLLGVRRSTAGAWSILIRNAGSDLVAPVALTVSAPVAIFARYEANTAQTELISIRLRVHDLVAGTLLGESTWTGGLTIFGLTPEAQAFRPVATGTAQDIMDVMYFGYGFDAPAGLDFSALEP